MHTETRADKSWLNERSEMLRRYAIRWCAVFNFTAALLLDQWRPMKDANS